MRTLGEEITKHRKRMRENALVHDKASAHDLNEDLYNVSCLA